MGSWGGARGSECYFAGEQGCPLAELFGISFQGLFFLFVQAAHSSFADLLQDAVYFLLLVGALGVVPVVDVVEVAMGLVEKVIHEQYLRAGDDKINK